MLKQYGGLWLTIRTYWKDYGGWGDLLRSPIFHTSMAVAIASLYGLIIMDWRTLTIGMMPTILGFSLAAYAITFSLMGTKLHGALARATDGQGKPLATSVNATLFHNVFIQSLCLSFAVISNGTLVHDVLVYTVTDIKIQSILIHLDVWTGKLVGSFLLIYAVLLLFSSGLAMFRLGRLTPSIQVTTPVANDEEQAPPEQIPARELYGIHWTIIRAVAKLLRVNG